MSALRWILYHRERPVVHDEPSRARGCFEVCNCGTRATVTGVREETVRKASSANQTPRHQTAHRYVDERFASLRQPLVVFAHPSVVVYPGERPLHYPPTW
jgi:hypothetical protein